MDMKRILRAVGFWLGFVVIGVFLAAVGEVQYSVFVRGDVANLLGSMGFNAMYLTLWAIACGLLLRIMGKRPLTILIIAAAAGFVGLMIEWYVIGNSPWGNPDASNVGMFAYWACLVVVPVALLDTAARTRRLRRNILIFIVVYSVLALLAQLIPSNDLRIAYHVLSVIVGYVLLLALAVGGLVRGWRSSMPGASTLTA